ncbi:MAG: hypothetical protein ACKOC5_08815 [Chloroflexota bacterium]
MDSIKIDTGVQRVCINDDPGRVIEFNPTSVDFAERFYQLIREFEQRRVEYSRRAEALGSEDIDGSLALMREMAEYMRGQIDFLFGAGSSQAAFGDALNLPAIGQFLDGITPFIQMAREKKVERYTYRSKGEKRVLK